LVTYNKLNANKENKKMAKKKKSIFRIKNYQFLNWWTMMVARAIVAFVLSSTLLVMIIIFNMIVSVLGLLDLLVGLDPIKFLGWGIFIGMQLGFLYDSWHNNKDRWGR